MEDKIYCMSSYLMLRTIFDHKKTFKNGISPAFFEENTDRNLVYNSEDLLSILKVEVEKACKNGKAAICLSGGIDSAILAKFMPKGSTAYTFRCIVPGIKVVDETEQAAKYAKECGLKHKIIDIYWDDCEKFAPLLMRHKGAPIHSIEVQIYKAALQAKADGFDTLIFGESADVNFGGQDGLFAKDWTTNEYIQRYSYLIPNKALVNSIIIREPFEKYSESGMMNVHEFNRHVYYLESMGSYQNACELGEMILCAPFSKTYLAVPIDISKIRNGENKYLVRDVFKILYPGWTIPKKVPMPRPMNEWMKNYNGPISKYFRSDIDLTSLSGDQKWQLWALDKFILENDI